MKAPKLTPKQKAAEGVYEALKAFVAAAESWHNFHNHTQIQCDLLCEDIAPGKAALDAYRKAGQP